MGRKKDWEILMLTEKLSNLGGEITKLEIQNGEYKRKQNVDNNKIFELME